MPGIDSRSAGIQKGQVEDLGVEDALRESRRSCYLVKIGFPISREFQVQG